MKTAMWKTHIIRLQLYIVVWQDILKTVVIVWLRSGHYSHQSLKIEDCMNAMIISLWLMWQTGTIDQRDIFSVESSVR